MTNLEYYSDLCPHEPEWVHTQLAEERANLELTILAAIEALKRLRDCDWVITPSDRMDAVRTIAREALVKMGVKN